MSKSLFRRLGYFDGVSWEDVLLHALPLEGGVDLPGVPVGITADSAKSPVGSDFTLQFQMEDWLSNKSIGIIGDQGIGKTFLLYVYLYIWSAEIRGRVAQGIQIDSLRHNNNERPETAPLVKDLLGCTVIEVNKQHCNPLNKLWDFTFDEQYAMVRTMLEVWWECKLTPNEEALLDRYLKISYETENPSFLKLGASIASYRGPEELTPLQAATMETAALELSNKVLALTRGKIGNVFSDEDDNETLLGLIDQFAKSWDFHGVDTKERSIIEVFRATIELSALELKDPENPKLGSRHPERVAQYIARDEAYDAWKNAIFAAHEFLRMKTLRERAITLVMCFHRLVDFTSSVGTDEARNVIREISTWIIGRQKMADLDDLREFLRLPEHVLLTLPTLPKGHFWLVQNGNARLFAVIGTQLELNTFVTNIANEALLQRYLETLDQDYYLKWLEETTPESKDGASTNSENAYDEVGYDADEAGVQPLEQDEIEFYHPGMDEPDLDNAPPEQPQWEVLNPADNPPDLDNPPPESRTDT